jgi:hypothetical protein
LQATFSVTKRGSAVTAGLVGCATARSSSDQIAALRKSPGLPTDQAISPGFLKNSDDQTVLALATISRAMIALNRPTASYQDWGVLAAANLYGRSGTFHSLRDFCKDGAWGITPHMIPHHSLHAVSGSISLALQIHGPNFGVGGGPQAVAEVFLAAATMVSENNLPGLWVVLTGHEPECLPNEELQKKQLSTTCLCAALALASPASGECASYLHISGCPARADWPDFTLADFFQTLEAGTRAGERMISEVVILDGRWRLPTGGWLRLTDSPLNDAEGDDQP